MNKNKRFEKLIKATNYLDNVEFDYHTTVDDKVLNGTFRSKRRIVDDHIKISLFSFIDDFTDIMAIIDISIETVEFGDEISIDVDLIDTGTYFKTLAYSIRNDIYRKYMEM